MTGVEFVTYIRKQTKTNTATFSDADVVMYANPRKTEIAEAITRADENYFGLFMKRNLTVGNRHYAFSPEQMNCMKYLEVTLDGVKWSKLTECDINTLGITTDEATILSTFAGQKPRFQIFGNEIFIFSGEAIIDVTDGLKLWTIIFPKDLTTASLALTDDLGDPPTSIDFGVPKSFHKIWADMVSVDYKNSQDQPIPLTKDEQLIPARLKEAVDNIRGANKDRTITAELPNDNDGQDN